MTQKKLKIRCWIEMDQTRFFGPGRAKLLELIAEKGSLSKAAQSMNMSYKKAWDMINDLNNRGSQPFVLLQKGGKLGGHAELTTFGLGFLKKYRQLDEKLQNLSKAHEELLDHC
ncbi:winged helix-turn-helix domain-containing protein [Pleomorphovibrio marinus]|uniref:winged helix-turn-helix domain-containing protein n=1 Tax=Pleomorphovibrio marinus TaxID=2164132 RepID=UPI000E0BDFBE|nr:LysR family transcriptional regulator [Pleomorphovibrio marinus]